MSARLSDAVVANLAVYAADAKPTTREVEALALEVQAWRSRRCDNCKHWTDMSSPVARYGLCGLAVVGGAALCLDGDDETAVLLVAADFACAAWVKP